MWRGEFENRFRGWNEKRRISNKDSMEWIVSNFEREFFFFFFFFLEHGNLSSNNRRRFESIVESCSFFFFSLVRMEEVRSKVF